MDVHLHTMVKLLNDNSQAITATAAIVGPVGAIIGWLISEHRRKADCKPILIFMEKTEQDGRDYSRALHVNNAGKGPALNVVRRINNDPLGIANSDETLLLGSVSPGETKSAIYARPPATSSLSILDDPEFHVTVECDDILGRHYSSAYCSRQQSTAKRVWTRTMLPQNADSL
jgi:hypothetical protein